MTRMFATSVPGLAPIVLHELGRQPGITVRGSGFDGRSDVVVFDAVRDARAAAVDLDLTEDLFVEVGRAARAEGDTADRVAGRLWRPEPVQRALSVWAEQVRPLSGRMTFRVVARVLYERSFLRTELRRRLTEVVRRDRPRWRVGDPAQLEVWVLEYAPGRFVAGLRLSDQRMRQHRGRAAEREGARVAARARSLVKRSRPVGGAALRHRPRGRPGRPARRSRGRGSGG
jgi:hypothetical protein